MLSNMSKSERHVRFFIGSLIWVLYLTHSIAGGLAHFLAAMGVIFIVTSIMNYCPYYLLFELSMEEDQEA